MSRHPFQAQADATRDSRLSKQEIAAIVDEWYESYAAYCRIDEDVYLTLRNRLIPLQPGEPVQFQELGKRRWLNGTFEGPVANPDDPRREGDVIVIRASHSPITDGRVRVFLSSVRRRS